LSYKNFRDHATSISSWFTDAMRKKYYIGQKEHGGRLWRKPTADELGKEVLDFVVYYAVLKDHLQRIKEICFEGAYQRGRWRDDPVGALLAIHNILEIGNEEGIEEAGD